MSGLTFTLAEKPGVAIDQATADLIVFTGAMADVAMGSLTRKCHVVQAVVANGRRLGSLTVDELQDIVQRVQA